jgi:MFS family permease
LTPWRFVFAFGVVSMLADLVYESARAITGPYLATLGASAALVGVVTGAGEAVALVFRLISGPLSDRTRRYWPITIAGYVMTVVAVPFLALTQTVTQAAAAVITERFGKAVRTPARDTMLAAASTGIGRGRAFALHEALDQSGALLGPLVMAAMISMSGYRLGFAVLILPGIAAVAMLGWLRRAVPNPQAYEHPTDNTPTTRPASHASGPDGSQGEAVEPWWRFSRQFWTYTAFTALTMAGYATFGVLSYHLHARQVVPDWQIPVIYAAAMGIDALAALGSGWVYDRYGLRGLIVLPVLAGVVPFLSFTTNPTLVWAGALIWGIALGVHESTMRAAVADLIPSHRRGTGYGTFTAIYGLAWLAGGALTGALYDTSISGVHIFILTTQTAALLVFLPLAATARPGSAPTVVR